MSSPSAKPWKVVVLAAFFISLQGTVDDQLRPLNFKGMWIVRDSMVSREEIDAALTFARDSGFNHVFVQVRGRGDAYYQSLMVPRSPLIRERRFDPLGYAISRGHELGLNVHAWVTTYLLWSARRPPVSGAHLYHMHPEWLEVNAAGQFQADIDLGAPRDGSFEGIFLSPVHPKVNGYLQALFTELILNYDIDGLHLDYCRYPDLDHGYNEEGLGRFRSAAGFDPRDILQVLRASAGDGGVSRVRDKLEIWNDYRRGRITDLMTALHAVITLSGKEIMLSAAVKPNAIVARHKYFQDWAQWLSDGILDYAILMNYTPDLQLFIENITVLTTALPARYMDRVVMGVAAYNQDAQATAEKIRVARLYGYGAICLFSYDAHKTNLPHFDPILEIMNR